jgi:hypothetical protein
MNEEIILEINLETGDNAKQLEQLTQLITFQKKEAEQLTTAIKNLSKAEGDQSDLIKQATIKREALTQSIKQNSANQKSLITIVNGEASSLVALNAQNKILTAQRNSLSTSTEKERDAIKRLNDRLDENQKKIRSLSTDYEKQKFNIGNYVKEITVGGTSIASIAPLFATPWALAATALVTLTNTFLASPFAQEVIGNTIASIKSLFGVVARESKEAITYVNEFKQAFISIFNDFEKFDKVVATAGLQALVENNEKRREILSRTIDDEKKSYSLRKSNAIEFYNSLVSEEKSILGGLASDISEAKKKLAEFDDQLIPDEEEIAATKRLAELDLNYLKVKNDYESRIYNALKQIRELEKPKEVNRPRLTLENENLLKGLEQGYKEQQLRDKENYLNTAQSQSEFQTQQFNSYIEYLNKRKEALELYGDDTFAVEQQIADAQIAEANRTANATNAITKKKTDNTLAGIQAVDNALGTSLAVMKENTVAFKIIAGAKALIDTYLAANSALTAGPFIGPILAAITTGIGLYNVSQIDGVAAAGGGDFYTNKPTLLLVGDNPGGVERVRVDPISGKGQTKRFNPMNGLPGVAMAGGGMLEVNRLAESSSQIRNLNSNLSKSQTVLVLQDFESAQQSKDAPINRANVLSK